MRGTAIRAVFFDAVGTLLHPVPSAAEVYAQIGRQFGSRRTLAEIGPRFRAAFRQEEALDFQQGLRTSEAREELRWRRIVAAVLDDVIDPEACFQELFAHFARPAAWRCDPDAAVLIQAMAARGLDLGLASNYDQRLHMVVAGFPQLALLRHVIVSAEIGWRKPASEFFAILAERAGCPLEQVLLVGDDRINDYDGARAAGLHALLLDPRDEGMGTERIERLSELQVD